MQPEIRPFVQVLQFTWQVSHVTLYPLSYIPTGQRQALVVKVLSVVQVEQVVLVPPKQVRQE